VSDNPYCFRCSACGCDQLECVQTGITLVTDFDVGPTGDINYGKQEPVDHSDEGETWFQCVECGQVIKENGRPIDTEERLVDWLEEQNERKADA